MDPFTEKDLVDCLKAISATLNNIDSRLQELTDAVREVGLELSGDDVGEDGFNQDGDDSDDEDDSGEEIVVSV